MAAEEDGDGIFRRRLGAELLQRGGHTVAGRLGTLKKLDMICRVGTHGRVTECLGNSVRIGDSDGRIPP
jgi:hypothetical protein